MQGKGVPRKKGTQKGAGKVQTSRRKRVAEGLQGTKNGEPSRVKRFKRLNPRELRMVEALAEANSISEAGRIAGYSPVTCKKASWYRKVHSKIRPITLAYLAKAGVTLPKIAEKMPELLEADQAIRLGKGEYEMVPDNLVRHKAMETYLRILGPLGRVAGDAPEDAEGTTVVVNIHGPGQRADPQGQGREPLTIDVDD